MSPHSGTMDLFADSVVMVVFNAVAAYEKTQRALYKSLKHVADRLSRPAHSFMHNTEFSSATSPWRVLSSSTENRSKPRRDSRLK